MLRIAKSSQCIRAAAHIRCLATEASSSDAPLTHYKITLRRSAISLGEKKQRTLHSLGITRRFQTVYMQHCPEVAGKILLLKELLEVENVRASDVRTKEEQTRERKAPRGYVVKGNRFEEKPWDT